jgi:uncharacterized protein YkwD
MLRMLLAALAALVLVAPAAALNGAKRSDSSLLAQMNRVRARYRLGPLRLDTHLERAARAHSREMLGSNVFEHGDFSGRMATFDVAGAVAGENLAWGTGIRGSARGIVSAWLASPEHRANLLRPSFSRVGVADLVGTFQGYSGVHVVTADFAG